MNPAGALLLFLGLVSIGAALAYATPAGAAALDSIMPNADAGDTGGAVQPMDAGLFNPDLLFAGFTDAVDTMPNAGGNLAAFLAMIRACEGTAGPDGYRTIVGGGKFESFSDHPRVRVPFTQTDGVRNYSTAAGAYQFLASTWDGLRAKLGLQDFSPASQDAAAIELIRERGALADVQAGRFDQAVAKVAKTWASLPGANYKQRTRSAQFAQSAYVEAGGAYG